MSLSYRVEVFEGDDGYHWRIRHANGNVLATSQDYRSHWNARRAGRILARGVGWEYREVNE